MHRYLRARSDSGSPSHKRLAWPRGTLILGAVAWASSACLAGDNPPRETYEPRPGCLAVPLEEVHALAPLDLDPANALWVIGDDDSPLHQVSDVKFLPTGDLLVMQDVGRTLRVYDASSGDLVTNVGSAGDGPGEFTQVFYFNISSQGYITLADFQKRRLVQLLPDFSPGEVVSMPDEDARTQPRGITDNGTILKTVRAPSHSRTLEGGLVVHEDWEYILADYEDAHTDTILGTIRYTAILDNQVMTGPSEAPGRGLQIAGPWVAVVEPDGLSIHPPDSRTSYNWIQVGSLSFAFRSSIRRDHSQACEPSQRTV